MMQSVRLGRSGSPLRLLAPAFCCLYFVVCPVLSAQADLSTLNHLEATLGSKTSSKRHKSKAGRVSSQYGLRKDPINNKKRFHKGIDIEGPIGAEVVPIAPGVVSFVGKKGAYGIVVEIQHDDGARTRYAHLQRAKVRLGESVSPSQSLGHLGRTGRATGPNLHFEVAVNDKVVNPQNILTDGKDLLRMSETCAMD